MAALISILASFGASRVLLLAPVKAKLLEERDKRSSGSRESYTCDEGVT